jgi:hypothetical protein
VKCLTRKSAKNRELGNDEDFSGRRVGTVHILGYGENFGWHDGVCCSTLPLKFCGHSLGDLI